VVGLCIYCGYQGFQKNFRSTVYYNAVYQHYTVVKSLIDGDAASQGFSEGTFTVMARDTWDVYEGTGYRTVMIPNNDLATILFVARHYDTRYMLLPAPRKALEDLYMGTTPDDHFRFIAAISGTDWKLFRVDPTLP
jgi:hypothetical protein